MVARNPYVLFTVCGLLLCALPSQSQDPPAEGAAGEAEEPQDEAEASFAETLTVTAASRRREPLVEAPAVVTAVGEEEAALTGTAGQIPSLLEFTVGTQITQSGIYDFNLNVRGFNGFLNRRIQTLVDGRDPSIPETSGMEWWTLSFLADDLASVELLRGPGSALYGANSINGVLSLVTREPRNSQGGKVGLIAGDLDTLIAHARVAGSLGRDWYFKALGYHVQSDSFTESRNESSEYPGVPQEAVPSMPGGIDSDALSLRLDKYLAGDNLLTLEGGGWTGGGETFMTQAGRVQQTDVDRTWGRLAYGAQHWSFGGNYTRRDGVALARQPGVFLYTQSRNARFELMGEHGFAHDRLHLVGGISYLDENVASADPRGVETLYEKPIDTHEEAVFLQATQELSPQLKAVVALRWDESTLHDSQVSPRASLVWAPGAGHTLRLAYNEAFQVGNYTELYLRIPGGPPLDLSVLETALAPLLNGVSLGLDSVPLFALGNPDLEVEKIKSFELGYNGILGAHLFLTADYYYNEVEDFISNLLPGVNPAFGPYQAPAQLSPQAAALVESTLRSLIPGLTNGPDGAPWIVASHTNTGRVDSQGLEVALSYQPSSRWRCQISGTWFDFDIREETPGAEVIPNTPEWQASASAVFRAERLSAALGFRWVDGFPWASGIFVGPVPSYQVMDLNLTYALSPSWEVGLDVSNLLDDAHYESFGGDLLRRRALGRVAFSW